ncbi:HD domain-containing protein [Patescibacteria group bacterium]|nr:HD domain-containing protein [Patescibacteria group bacterium]
MDEKNILNYFFELGQLKKIEHEGWRLAGVTHPETVAGHALRAAQIGFVLAKMEKYKNPQEVCTMIVFHDIAECRTGDIHKVANRYVKKDEQKAVKDQLKNINEIGDDIFKLWQQVEQRKTTAGIIAKDADLLEQALLSKEYVEQGFSTAQDWIDNVNDYVMTDSAKKILKKLDEVKSTDWWQGLKQIDLQKPE